MASACQFTATGQVRKWCNCLRNKATFELSGDKIGFSDIRKALHFQMKDSFTSIQKYYNSHWVCPQALYIHITFIWVSECL